MKKILILSQFENTIISFKGALIKDLIKKKYTVFILAPNYSKKTKNYLIQIGANPIDINLNRLSLSLINNIKELIRLIFLFKKLKPDIFIGYYLKSIIFGLIAAKIVGVNKKIVFFEGLGRYFTEIISKENFKKNLIKNLITLLLRICLKFSNHIFFLNKDDKDLFQKKKLIYKKTKIHIINGIGLEIDKYPPLKPSNKNINFLFMGRIMEEKGAFDFMDAAIKIKARYPKVTFSMLGTVDQKLSKNQKLKIKYLKKNKIIEFPGHVNINPWLKKCSVFVLPSYREGRPRSTQEAMASSKPIISTNAPGCRQTVINKKNGYLVKIGDIQGLVNAMEKFINNPKLISIMGKQSRVIAENIYDVKKINNKIINKIQI